MNIDKAFIGILLLTGLTACTPVHYPSGSVADADRTAVNRDVLVLDVRKKTGLASIVPELARHQVVLVGERHTRYSDHLNQLAVIKALYPLWRNMGIGLECVQSPYQKVLDAYIAGEIGDAQMLKQTQWYQRWKYDFRLYRGIFHFARKHRIPLVALNAPTELTRKISKRGIAGLVPKDRQYLPKQIIRGQAYRDRLLNVFQQHSHTRGKKLDNFIDVQLAWDESMALNAARAINSGRVTHMVLLAGSGHVVRQGIPARLDRRLATRSLILVNQFEEDLSQIDFVLQSLQGKLPTAGKIGIMMEGLDNQQGVRVVKVLKKHKASMAKDGLKRGGLKKGDIILSLDKHRIDSPDDIKINLLDKKPGDVLALKIRRANKVIHQIIHLF